MVTKTTNAMHDINTSL